MIKIIIFLMAIFVFLISGAEAKRRAPAEIPPLIHDDLIYTAPHWGSKTGRCQNGGYIEVRGAKSGALLWELKIYTVQYTPALERDVQDIFITKMEFQNHSLVIWNERNDKFTVGINTREVEPKNRVYP